MKKIVCLLVVFLISNGVNAADKWEYCSLKFQTLTITRTPPLKNILASGLATIQLPNTKIHWEVDLVKPLDPDTFAKENLKSQKQLVQENIPYIINQQSQSHNQLYNALGNLGWEMVSTTRTVRPSLSHHAARIRGNKIIETDTYWFYFKRNTSK